jgi:TonB family protein
MKRILTLTFAFLLLTSGATAQTGSGSTVVSGGQKDATKDAASKSKELAEAARLNSEVVRLFGEGKYDEALPLAKRVLEIRERLLGDDVLVVYALDNLASIYMEKKKDGDAEALYKRSLGMLEKIGAGASDVAAEVNTRLGEINVRSSYYKEAEPLFLRSLEIEEKTHGTDDPAIVPSLLNLADLSYYRHDTQAMIGYLDRAVTILDKQAPRKDLSTANRLYGYLCPLKDVKGVDKLSGRIGEAAYRLEEPEKAAEFERQEKERAARGDSDKNDFKGRVLTGRAIFKPAPPYPAEAKEQGIVGAVILQITVDETGKVVQVKKICGHPLLVKAAIEAAYRWRFSPTLLSGMPVQVTGTITINFTLP